MSVIVIDPGHGGETKVGGSSPNNATGPSGTLEKHLTLDLARHAAAALKNSGHSVILTRNRDVNLRLDKRAAIAKDAGAEVFVSIHFNGFGDPQVQGTETWVHLLAGQAPRDLAARVQKAMLDVTLYHDRGVQSKTLGVLDPAHHDPATAACLAEVSFITSPADERRLQDDAYKQALGKAIAAGIADYLTARALRVDSALRAAVAPAAMPKRARPILGLGGRADPIEHVVVLMLENRSFDHMLGGLWKIFPTLDGIDPAGPGRNIDQGRVYKQAPTLTTALECDPKHELENVRTQLDLNGERCGGFVTDFRNAYLTPPHVSQEVMGYYEFGTLSVLHRLAAEFTVCDRWFSSVPGPTWTNRLFVHSGTSQGRVEMSKLSVFAYNQDTIYDRLNERDIDWAIYYGDVPQSLVLTHQRRWPWNAWKYYRFDGLFADGFVAKTEGSADDFPAYVFIEPNYFHNQNDQHPPSDVNYGEVLLARVYNALRANEALWERTLLVVLYDEHGGFYDHVYPGPAVPPDDHREEYTFDQYGVRVPALLISPWMKRGPYKTELDHTSLLKYLTDKWQLAPLGARAVHANSFADAFLAQSRTNTPEAIDEPSIPKSRAALAVPARAPALNDLQRALLAMTEVLELETRQPVAAKVARSVRMLDGPGGQAQVAQERVERFLQQQRTERIRRR